MIYVSDEHKTVIANRPLYKLTAWVYKAGHTITGNEVLGTDCDFELAESDFYASGNMIRCDNGGEFPIGNVVSRTCTLSIHTSDSYSASDFAGAFLVLVIRADDGENDPWIVTGDYYFVQTVSLEDGKITLECCDFISKSDKLYSCDIEFTSESGRSTLTLSTLFSSVAKQMCSIATIDTTQTASYGGYYSLSNLELESTISYNAYLAIKNNKYTCRQILGFIALYTHGNVIVGAGSLELRVNSALYYNYVDNTTKYYFYGHGLSDKWISFEDGAESVTVTGLECTVVGADDTETTYKSTTYSSGYVLDVSENPFISNIDADLLSASLESMRRVFAAIPLRNFAGEFMSYPRLEYGDWVNCTHLGGTLSTLITGYEWNISGATTLSCEVQSSAESGAVYSVVSYSSTTASSGDSSSDSLPTIQYGIASVSYHGTKDKSTSVTFTTAFSSTPVVICQQVFNSINCCIHTNNVSVSGFTIEVPPISGVSGTLTRDVMWIAIGT